ncbi:hypothetical protein PV328_001110 [Microctonus aethiopoides]|uniref:Uncharacterized protein n=1 Tax=Microctonus aethiopoides TaxID=144406 RepID=A0AA39FXG9_9HYME|nr:hypothetical protein PV328_001110 [Microctonus aethiopoides]
MSDTCFICKGLLSDSDVVEVRRGLETLKNSCIARGDGKNEYSKIVTFVNVHSNCRKNYTNDLSITAFKRCQEEPRTSVSYLHVKKESVLLILKNYDTVLKTADVRDDKYGKSVMERINFEYDLVSVEAKYHDPKIDHYVFSKINIQCSMLENHMAIQFRKFRSVLLPTCASKDENGKKTSLFIELENLKKIDQIICPSAD